jgi:trehalose 6-phosphate synthase
VLPDRIRRAIHDGVLANDVVGFHTHQWRLNFMRAAIDVAGAEGNFVDGVVDHAGRRSLVTVHPISVDAAEFDELAGSEAVLAAEQELVERRPEQLVLRVDRTDPSKNIVRGFRAFELYLEAHPERHRRVAMLALLDPSRQDIAEYSEYLGAIQREARRVNDRFQQNGWLPIELVIEDDFAGSVAAYKQFDALFVNAIFDGMNLVAKEAPLVNKRDGVLILSENAGVHAELGEWALTVNPFDVAGQAQAIHEALTMAPVERHERLGAIRAHVREHDVARWIEAQLADLDRCRASVG